MVFVEAVSGWGFPPDASAAGKWVDELFGQAAFWTGSAFLGVAAILAVCLILFRERPGRRAHYTHGESRGSRWATACFAVSVFLVLDVQLAFRDHLAWEKTWGRPPVPSEAVRVEVMPEQFAWNIRYPGPDGAFRTADDVTSINQLCVPLGRPVAVRLTSRDVIHSFFLPNFRVKMDAVPGMVTALHFTAKEPGTYDIACAEHCGFGHYRMRGFLTVLTPEEFETWLADRAKEDSPDMSWGWDWEAGL